MSCSGKCTCTDVSPPRLSNIDEIIERLTNLKPGFVKDDPRLLSVNYALDNLVLTRNKLKGNKMFAGISGKEDIMDTLNILMDMHASLPDGHPEVSTIVDVIMPISNAVKTFQTNLFMTKLVYN